MCMTVGRAGFLVVSATFALAIFIASTALHAAETSEAFIVPLFPQKEADLKKGLPPGMTAYSFWAGRGTAKLRRLDNGGAQITFDFEGLIPYGLYTLWNVLETNPFTAMLDGPAVAADDPALVIMKNHQFEPRLLQVRPGQAIRFDNSDDVLHSLLLVGRESVIGEEFVDSGQSYTVRIPQDMPPGTYELACTVHVDMRSQIVVSGE